MWFDQSKAGPWDEALNHLRRDPVMRAAIEKVGPCTLGPRRDYFIKLCQSIFSQQVSVKAAAAMFHRFRQQFPRKTPTPQRVFDFLTAGDEELIRQCGLSRQKKAYLIDLSQHLIDGRLRTRNFPRMTDEEVSAALVNVKGIGVWTAEMFLIFCLNRPDVWPVLDLGLQEAVKVCYGLDHRPAGKELQAFGERYRPWRSIATWYLWRAKEG